MKKINRLICASLLIIFFSSLQAQEKPGFNDIDLNELKRTVLKQLHKDRLITKKSELVYLSLKQDGIELNGQKMPVAVSKRYDQLLSGYHLGRGPYRTILISQRCTAVGDFREDSFFGKSQGRLNLVETWRNFKS